ncbi:FkbO/Hyg5 family chorismatase [Amycolatopsis sp. EV170708-02-1]|uniref:FkbO/Hyg5 family chorismatase n=1 Tax=Amycolatopsis sp. EV170708-02-1 TaxID=2919322 RepID=UPI001F0C2C65|nr:FkbO/Hyg5 family chorismatase [Amycolatopsis sp. EV170708-02-1]UMP07006.1 FkbO/Hyg5 family chorismatase [Amycolatopsis sp. EV170708-02-1]
MLISSFQPDSAATSTVLGAVTYGLDSRDPHLAHGFPELTVHAVTDPADGFTEVWHSDGPVEHGTLDGVVHAYDGENLFCAARIDDGNDCMEAVRAAYTTALGLTRTLGYERIFRMWNFIENINGTNSKGLEIYQDFCQGRSQAFREFAFTDSQLPAATGVGALGGGIGFCLLAGRSVRRVNVENSRQMPAWRYPERYGPSSPSFARATYVASPNRGAFIYVSGTASVVGHETVHPGHIADQCGETLTNIEHLLSSGNLAVHDLRPGRRLEDLRDIKVYVRRRQDLHTVREICAKAFSPAADIAFLNLDLCRADLLVEIEGVVFPE